MFLELLCYDKSTGVAGMFYFPFFYNKKIYYYFLDINFYLMEIAY